MGEVRRLHNFDKFCAGYPLSIKVKHCNYAIGYCCLQQCT